jgi:hypothetical protein
MPTSVQNRVKSRVYRLSIRLNSRRQLNATFRRFRTRPENRSKRIKQLVVHLPFTTYREAAVTIVRVGRNKRTYKRHPLINVPTAVLILGLSGVIYFGLNLETPATIRLVGSSSVSAAPVKAAEDAVHTKVLPRSEPLNLHIEKINLDTTLTPVGLEADGSIAMPDGFDIAGWYTHGPTPGELGPAVIVGHVDSTEGIAIFWRLRELMPGDEIIVDRQDGRTARFRVDDIELYSQDEFPTEKVYGNIDHSGLRLITCGGTFSTMTHHYSDNIVVYASLE